MAARPLTSPPLSQTGPWLQMTVCVCQSAGQCVCSEHRWDVRPCVLKCLNRATHIFLSRCSLPSVMSRHVRSQMCASSCLPMHASVDREVCVWTGETPTSVVSKIYDSIQRTQFNTQSEPKLQPGLCVTALQCPSSMEYEACRTGCVDDCGSTQRLRGDWPVARGNDSSCMDTPTEGCFCTGGTVLHHGQCVSPEACRQCVDQKGRTYSVRLMRNI